MRRRRCGRRLPAATPFHETLPACMWRVLARLTGMAQGATQFCRRSVFEQVGGYDEGAWIGEDVDFYWSLKKLAKRSNRTVRFIRNMRVRPSSRRFDKWPIWKILIWTNPSPCSSLVLALSAGMPGHRTGRLLDPKVRVPGNFPQVTLRVGKVSGVTAPECVLGRLDEGGAGGHGYLQ